MGLKKLQVHEERRTDSCWSWVVCISSFVVYFFVYGQIYSFGSLFVALLEEFGRGEAETGKFFHGKKIYVRERLNRTFRICDMNIFVLFLTENISLFCCCDIPRGLKRNNEVFIIPLSIIPALKFPLFHYSSLLFHCNNCHYSIIPVHVGLGVGLGPFQVLALARKYLRSLYLVVFHERTDCESVVILRLTSCPREDLDDVVM